ncbi:flagellar basal body P-ring protein FlgI [Granulicella sp. 5B5]|uniref:flagellar basal body P-ring protein FlgI n=1 Tax=Granulicella sp. 5B5 TaxID=1617967 RepID=UPI0021062A91|nr:flagellar basal body P-ring protein FlgI [Granulicella sp. 5B5]
MAVWVLMSTLIRKYRSSLLRDFYTLCLVSLCIALSAVSHASDYSRQVLIRDITEVEGVRSNQLVGYGLVVGLHGTGDSQQTYLTVQTLANAMQRMGIQITPSIVVVRNVAAVFVTADLPPFSRPGMDIDITVSSIGDARSLEGGVLLLTSLRGVDGEAYAQGQGPLTIGGYTQGGGLNSKVMRHPTVGTIADGGIVERDAAVDISHLQTVSLLLRNPDFTSARHVADAVNREFGKTISHAVDSRRIDVSVAESGVSSVPVLLSRIQGLAVEVQPAAKVVVNERTGTIVLGGDVTLSPVVVMQAGLTIQILPSLAGTAPQAPSSTNVPSGQTVQMQAGASVDELLKGLRVIGASSQDILAILQAIKAAGGLQADLEVI